MPVSVTVPTGPGDHAAVVGEFQGVGQQVAQHLAQPHLVAETPARRARVDLHAEGQVLFGGQGAVEPAQVGHQGGRIEGDGGQFQPADLDL